MYKGHRFYVYDHLKPSLFITPIQGYENCVVVMNLIIVMNSGINEITIGVMSRPGHRQQNHCMECYV